MFWPTKEAQLFGVLQIAAALCFIGHGAFGIITKPIWCNYFAVFGIHQAAAYRLMPVLGSADILMGISLLVYPVRPVAIWLVIWGFITALLRPLSGEPFAELIERSANFGAPLALLLLWDKRQSCSYGLQKIESSLKFCVRRQGLVRFCLQISGFLLLTGHGWLNLISKKGLVAQYITLGFHDPHVPALTFGILELGMALIVLFRPVRPLVLIIIVWKVITELFYPHWEIFEWIERGGSYGVLIALWLIIDSRQEVASRTVSFSKERIYLR